MKKKKVFQASKYFLHLPLCSSTSAPAVVVAAVVAVELAAADDCYTATEFAAVAELFVELGDAAGAPNIAAVAEGIVVLMKGKKSSKIKIFLKRM